MSIITERVDLIRTCTVEMHFRIRSCKRHSIRTLWKPTPYIVCGTRSLHVCFLSFAHSSLGLVCLHCLSHCTRTNHKILVSHHHVFLFSRHCLSTISSPIQFLQTWWKRDVPRRLYCDYYLFCPCNKPFFVTSFFSKDPLIDPFASFRLSSADYTNNYTMQAWARRCIQQCHQRRYT